MPFQGQQAFHRALSSRLRLEFKKNTTSTQTQKQPLLQEETCSKVQIVLNITLENKTQQIIYTIFQK